MTAVHIALPPKSGGKCFMKAARAPMLSNRDILSHRIKRVGRMGVRLAPAQPGGEMRFQNSFCSKSRLLEAGVSLILSALIAGAGLYGQDARGRISGRVSDQSGSPV